MSAAVVLTAGAQCEYEGCTAPAETLASGRSYWDSGTGTPGHGVGVYCVNHAGLVVDEGHPEYDHTCPNCGCVSGVN